MLNLSVITSKFSLHRVTVFVTVNLKDTVLYTQAVSQCVEDTKRETTHFHPVRRQRRGYLPPLPNREHIYRRGA
jgi:hypothetical protein